MADRTPEYAARSIRKILDELKKPVELEQAYAMAVLAQAVRNAAGRPTPQAPMAARVLNVEQGTIGTNSSGAAADVGMGSEFGSNVYPQFQRPPTRAGYWLWPAARSTQVAAAGDEALEKVLDDIVKGAG